MQENRILIVDDDESMCQYLSILLEKEGYQVDVAHAGVEALARMEGEPYAVVLSDIQMPGLDGIQLLKGIKAIDPQTPVIMLTAFANEQSAIDAVNLGAYSYLQKHCKNDEIKVAVRNAMNLRNASRENQHLRRELKRKRGVTKIVGNSVRMQSVYRMVDKISATGATVLLTGESGTGKELIARTIHDRSERSDKPFVAINCGAIPETLLESQLFGHVKGSFTNADREHDGFCRQAEGGTIFLDEIGETPLAIQVKLLRMLQEREIYPVGSSKSVKVDLRVIAATNLDLEQEVERGNFRKDLFYRLNVIPIDLPALRDRVDDIPLLCDHFLRKYWPEYPGKVGQAIDDDAMNLLVGYPWPGNVRELENVIERATIVRDDNRISRQDLPVSLTETPGVVEDRVLLGTHVRLEDIERRHILTVLESVGGHKKQAAEILDINPSTLYRKLLRYDETMVDPRDERDFVSEIADAVFLENELDRETV